MSYVLDAPILVFWVAETGQWSQKMIYSVQWVLASSKLASATVKADSIYYLYM